MKGHCLQQHLPSSAEPPEAGNERGNATPVSVLTELGGKGKEEKSGTLMDVPLETEFGERDLDIAMLSRRGSEKQMLQKG